MAKEGARKTDKNENNGKAMNCYGILRNDGEYVFYNIKTVY